MAYFVARVCNLSFGIFCGIFEPAAGAFVARNTLRCFVQLNRRFGAGTSALQWVFGSGVFLWGVLNRRFNVRTWCVYRHAHRKFYGCSLAPTVQLGALPPNPRQRASRPLESSACAWSVNLNPVGQTARCMVFASHDA